MKHEKNHDFLKSVFWLCPAILIYCKKKKKSIIKQGCRGRGCGQVGAILLADMEKQSSWPIWKSNPMWEQSSWPIWKNDPKSSYHYAWRGPSTFCMINNIVPSISPIVFPITPKISHILFVTYPKSRPEWLMDSDAKNQIQNTYDPPSWIFQGSTNSPVLVEQTAD